MASAANGMEVDPPNGRAENEALGLNPLKRSNSAPMLASTATTTPTSGHSPIQATSCSQSFSFTSNSISKTWERMRRYSSSSMGLNSTPVSTPIKIPSRLDQIKHEERIGIKEFEAAQEKDNNSTMQLSQSWEELSLTDHEPMAADCLRRPRSFQEPLHIVTPPFPYTSSPSPTRIGKQCFSPSLGYPVSTVGNALSPSPSPTRKFSRRSHSPIIFQPSRLQLKRKINVDMDGSYESYTPPPTKRIMLTRSPGLTPDATYTVSHPLLHSISSSSLSETSGLEQHETSNTSSLLCTTPQVTSAHRRRNTPSPLCTSNSFQTIGDSLPDSERASNVSHIQPDSSHIIDRTSFSGFRRPPSAEGDGG